MLEGKYKIVRDKTINELKKNYTQVLFRKLTKKDFRHYLQLRLKEEVSKLLSSENKKRFLEKMADIYEVLDYILKEEKITKTSVERIKRQTKKQKGGFDKKYLLISLEE